MTDPAAPPLDLGPVGVWSAELARLGAGPARELAQELDELGYGALWIPEATGRDPFVSAALLLDATRRTVLATGIANIHLRTAHAMGAIHRTVEESFPGRFLLGLGVSHAPMLEGMWGIDGGKPIAAMRTYLDGMDGATFSAARPPTPPRRVLAALGPRMLEVARDQADGAHPYLVTPAHTATARAALGPDRILAPEQHVALVADPTAARALAREHLAGYFGLPNYVRSWFRLGFGEDDLVGGGSDRLVDALVAWGDADAIAARVREHRDAGADHVCVQVLPVDREPPRDAWRELAGVLC